MTTSLSTLKTVGLKKKYKQRYVVKGTSFHIQQGEIVGLLGPNGAGKTTSFYMTVGLVKPTEGQIFLNSIDITKLPIHERAKLGIGYLAQEASIFRKLTVRENIEAILEYQKITRIEIRKKSDELIDKFELNHVKDQYGYTLSGGERRRTEIARVIAGNPIFILLDEPFAGVDPIAVKDIQNVVRSLKDQNYGILITDHNVRETLKITDRAYIMYQGDILVEGNAQELANDQKAKEIYLGDDFTI